MKDRFWNYDLDTCPFGEDVLVKLSNNCRDVLANRYPDSVDGAKQFIQFIDYKLYLITRDIVAWCKYDSPKEPEVWIELNNGEIPNCNLNDVIKLKGSWNCGTDSAKAIQFAHIFLENTGTYTHYCIVKKADENV